MSATHASNATAPSLSAMARIETLRLARNPFFIIATLVAFALPLLFGVNSEHDTPGDLLSWTVIPAFFVGLTSLVLMARQTRSTEAAAEAMAAAPGTEARRTQALIVACLLPAAVGVAYLVEMLIIVAIKEPAPQEWWFGTMNDAQVWAALVANSPVACFGGALLGVLSGRWLRFRGASAVLVIGLVVVDMFGQAPGEEDIISPTLRLWTPWATWQSGTDTDGTATLYGGNAVFYLVYAVCLCAAAALAALWHDKHARSTDLRRAFAAVVLVGLVGLGLSMTTGTTENRVSDPVPWKVEKG